MESAFLICSPETQVRHERFSFSGVFEAQPLTVGTQMHLVVQVLQLKSKVVALNGMTYTSVAQLKCPSASRDVTTSETSKEETRNIIHCQKNGSWSRLQASCSWVRRLDTFFFLPSLYKITWLFVLVSLCFSRHYILPYVVGGALFPRDHVSCASPSHEGRHTMTYNEKQEKMIRQAVVNQRTRESNPRVKHPFRFPSYSLFMSHLCTLSNGILTKFLLTSLKRILVKLYCIVLTTSSR